MEQPPDWQDILLKLLTKWAHEQGGYFGETDWTAFGIDDATKSEVRRRYQQRAIHG